MAKQSKKAAQFVKQAERRVQRAIKSIDQVGRLATANVERTDAQEKQIIAALIASVKRVETAFSAKAQAAEVFRLA